MLQTWNQSWTDAMDYELTYNIEPGLLNALRIYTIIGLVISLVFYAASVFQANANTVTMISILLIELQLVYLFVPWFQRRLGKAYLPLFFIYATVEMIASNWFTATGMNVSGADELTVYTMLLFAPPLFFLALLISWQYSVKYVILFAVVTTIPELLLIEQTAASLDQSQMFIAMALISRAIMFSTVGYFVTHLMNQQRRLRHELSTANSKITSFATMMESLTTSRERNRMARELHDTLAHTLTNTTVQLEAAGTLWDTQPEKAQQLVQLSLQITRDGLHETRRALQDLRSSPLENLGLVLAIRDLCETTQKRTGGHIEMQFPASLEHISAPVEQTIYRVAQEALENIVRHARASQICIEIAQQDDWISMQIEDNGRGFELDSFDTAHHFGIQGMMERVAAFGGSLILNSAPGSGTQLRLEMRV